MSRFKLLRPHHGLCIRYFRGKGYSEEFVRHMTAVIARLEETDPLMQLYCGCDHICAHCPHDHGGLCKSAEKVRRFDESVLQLCGLKSGASLHWSEFCRLVDAHILQPRRMAEVCSDCDWYAFCRTLTPAACGQTASK